MPHRTRYHTHSDYMDYALRLARRGLGRTSPNPSVGCIIVKNNRIVGVGRTQDGGRPHAEIVALNMAGDHAAGADIYVTLEPCCFHGVSGACTDALIQVKPANVFIACHDPHPNVSGQGVKKLTQAGIKVHVGLREKEAKDLNNGFFLRVQNKRPHITLKTAMSADGKVALESGESKWITGDLARRKAHQIRTQHDAILCGINTVLHDDPMLNARIKGVPHPIIRIVLDRHLRIPLRSKLLQTAKDDPVWIFYEDAKQSDLDKFNDHDARIFQCNLNDLESILNIISENNVTRLLIEGGPTIHTAFLKENLWDEFYIFQSPKILGGKAVPVLQDLKIKTMQDCYRLQNSHITKLGDDNLIHYKKN